MSDDCFICEKHNGNIKTAGVTIYEDEFVYVGHIDKNGEPNYLGHIMIDLKRHIATLGEMNKQEAMIFGWTMARVSRALQESEKAEHVYALVSGNSVPHVHMHIVARYPNTPKEHWGPMEVYDWEDAPMGNEEKVIELCQRLKRYMEDTYHE